ncbi:hypothetical protein RUND412_000351 [Rhizina undulata]
MYSVIWDTIHADTEVNYRLAESTLKWILCTKSPLTLDEILDAVSITPMKWVERLDHVYDDVSYLTLLDVCQNLVVLDEEFGVLRTAHFSVTEFLLEKLDIRDAHSAAAEVCLTLLCCENHFRTSCQTENYVLDNYVLHDYVMQNWAEHIRLSGDGSRTLAELQIMFFKPSPAYSKWLLAASLDDWDLQSEDSEIPLNPLWVACYFRLWDIFKYLLRSNPNCIMRNRFGLTPIHLIASQGYRGPGPFSELAEVVKLLLEQKGVDLNAKDNDDSDGLTPLFAAAGGGHEEVVRLLQEQEGVDVNAKDNDGLTPLEGLHTVHGSAVQDHGPRYSPVPDQSCNVDRLDGPGLVPRSVKDRESGPKYGYRTGEPRWIIFVSPPGEGTEVRTDGGKPDEQRPQDKPEVLDQQLDKLEMLATVRSRLEDAGIRIFSETITGTGKAICGVDVDASPTDRAAVLE